MNDQQPGTIATAIHGRKLLLTARETAHALSICERSLWTLTDEGVLPAVRIGRSVRYSVADLQAYIERCRQSPDA